MATATAEAIRNRPLPDEDIGGDDAELLRVARERYQKGIDAEYENRIQAVEDLEFLAGHQWPDVIRHEREQDNRPIITINRMPQFVHQVTGDLRQNKTSIKVRPADDVADEEAADVYTGLIRHIEAASDASIAYLTAAEQAAQCGIGHFRIVTEYAGDDIFEQDIRLRRITDPFGVTWDPQSVDPTRRDARWCFVEESLDVETFKARYPKASLTDWDSKRHDNTTGSYAWVGDWLQHETIRVAEYWTREPEKRTLALLADGRVIDVTDMMEYEGAYISEDGEVHRPMQTRKVWRDKVEMRIINGAEVLEGPFEWAGRYIPIVPIIGEEIWIGRRLVRHGVIRHAKDAQRMYNYWAAAQTEYVAMQPKSPFVGTVTNFEGLQPIWRQANNRNQPYLPYNPDPKNNGERPQRDTPPMASQGMAQERLLAAEDLKATTGIYDASLGAPSNEKSGIAIQRRQQESDVSTFTYSDNVSRALRHAGQILVDLIPKIYDTPRTVRILNEDDTVEAAAINQTWIDENGDRHVVNDLRMGKYDVVVSTGPAYSTKRAEAAEGMINLVSAMPDLGKLIADILVKNLDWPGADEIEKRLRKALPPGLIEPEEGEELPEPPPDPEMVKAAAELELEGREAERKEAETAAKVAETLAKADAQQIENAQARLMLGFQQSPEFQSMVERMIREQLAGLIGQPDQGAQQPAARHQGNGAAPPMMQ